MAGGKRGVRAGRAYVEASLDDSALVRGLRAAEKRLQAWGASITGIGAGLSGLGAAIMAPLTAAAAVFADVGSQLADMSARTGVSVEALSSLGYAAQQTGADLGTLEAGMRRAQKSLADAAAGSESAEVAFAALGLDVARLMAMSPERQFAAIAAALRAVTDPTVRAAAAMEVFGRSGTALLPMIDDLEALTSQAREFGLVMSGEEAESADALGDSMDLLKTMLTEIVRTVGSALAPAWTAWNVSMARTLATVRDWIAAHRPLVVIVSQIGLSIAAAGVAFIGLGTALSGAGAALGLVASAITGIGATLAAVLSPIGLVVAGLAGLTYWFTRSTAYGGQALAWLGRQFRWLLQEATAVLGGISDAMTSGDIGLAAQVLWAGLRVQWLRGVGALNAVWADWGLAVRQGFADVSTWLAGEMIDLSTSIQATWAQLTSEMTGSWGTMLARLIKMLVPFTGAIEQALGIDIGQTVDDALAVLGVDQGGQDAEARRKAELDARIAAIGRANMDQRAALDDQAASETDARRAAAQDGLASGESDLAAAQADLDSLLGRARARREAVGAGPAPREGRPPELDLDGIGDAVQSSAAKVDVAGGFSAFSVAGLGAGSTIANDQLKEQKKQSSQLEKLNRKIDTKAAVFIA